LIDVRLSLQQHMNRSICGWHNMLWPDYFVQEQILFRNGAKKYEAGTHNLLGLAGLVSAMELILEVRVENVSHELLRKRALLEPAIEAKGYTILQTSSPPENSSAIISMHRPGSDVTPLHQKLLDAGII